MAIIIKLVWLLLGCLLIGWLTGQTAWALVAGLALYLFYTLWQTQRLQRWLQTRPGDPPPEARGLWGLIFDEIYRLQRRDQRARARLQAVIERIQASTAALRDGVVMLDKDGHLEWWNHAAEQLLGLRAPETPSPLNLFMNIPVQADGTVYATSLRTVINVTTGKRIRSPEGASTWDRPQGIAVARDGTMYVSELRPGTLQGSRVVRGSGRTAVRASRPRWWSIGP